MRKAIPVVVVSAALVIANLAPATAKEDAPSNQVVITNVDVWDGRSSGVSKGLNVDG
jgi:hypothetical protein